MQNIPVDVIAILVALIAAWSVIIIGTAKWIVGSGLRSLQAALKANCDEQQKITRDVLEMKADLPLSYVRKEDFIRHEVVINTKLDRLRDLISELKEKR